MKVLNPALSAVLFLLACTSPESIQNGLESIKASDLEHHLSFIASDEMRGRNTPSTGLDITAAYLSNISKYYGLKPVTGDSYFQEIELETIQISEIGTSITLKNAQGNKIFTYLKDFGMEQRRVISGKVSGGIVFIGYGFQSPDLSWNDLNGIDLTGKVAVILEAKLPNNHPLRSGESRMLVRYRTTKLAEMGAVAILRIISENREDKFANTGMMFDNPLKSIVADKDVDIMELDGEGTIVIDIRHQMASSILGISNMDLRQLLETTRSGQQLDPKEVKGTLNITLKAIKGKDNVRNVLAVSEGKNPALADEYIIIGAHYDHIGITEEEIYNGANDNGSGTVSLIELAQALEGQEHGRSIILAWFTGEEQGLWGSEYFVANPPVPIEQIAYCINLDVTSGNDLSKITMIGNAQEDPKLNEIFNKLSTDQIQVHLDYLEDEPTKLGFLYSRSDHYPFIKHDIQAIWISSESDGQEHIHQPSDMPEFINYQKMELVTRFTYLAMMEFSNISE